ncbi:hypothetical protein O181_069003 [Austropuccinia psidii MF-1]|uniref:Reverse transcriptase domain-containing protein n=1 Tax=Austropuccinia psidii MF-1 TaxID=1389203 RepID=A0A9Q3F1F4_9BASI|nr:hypothetical protein [Austropuccinia psidii MF-1]
MHIHQEKIQSHQIIDSLQESALLARTTLLDVSNSIPQLTLLSLHNPPTTFTVIQILNQWLQVEATWKTQRIIMMDSNLHHLLWNTRKYNHTHTQAKDLIEICGKKGFHPSSPKHIPTFLGASLDNKLFLETLHQNLGQSANTTASVECTTQDLTAAISKAYNNQGKWVTTNPARSKVWWNKEQLYNLVKLRNKVWELKSSHWRKFLAKRGPEHAYQVYKFTKDKQEEIITSLRNQEGNLKLENTEKVSLLFYGTLIVEIEEDLNNISHQQKPILPASFIQYPVEWKEAQTAIIRKAAKDDYANPNAYRPITLLNTLGKLFDKIINNHLMHWAHQTNSVHPGHMGGDWARALTTRL